MGCSSKVLLGVALALSVIALVIKSVAISVPHFVDVHLIRDIDDQADSNRIAGVGVFQSEFNTETNDENFAREIDEANLPVLKVESPSTEFPLLFPAQENFIADVLPLNDALLDDLDETFGNAIKPVIEEEQDAIQNLEFDNCENFMTTTFGLNIAFFEAFQTPVLPIAVQGISILTAEGIDEQLSALNEVVLNAAASGGALLITSLTDAALTAAVVGDQVNCGALAVTGAETPVDATIRTCLSSGFITAGDDVAEDALLHDLLSAAIATEIGNCPDGVTVEVCLQLTSQIFQIVDGPIAAPVAFTVDGNVCAFVGGCGDADLKFEYLGVLTVLLGEIVDNGFDGAADAGDALQAVGAYLLAFQAGLIELTDTFADDIDAVPVADLQDSFFPENATDAYPPCDTLTVASIFFEGQGLIDDATDLFGGVECVSFDVYLVGLVGILEISQNPLLDDVAAIVDLYFTCIEVADGDLLSCPGIFAQGLIDGAFNGIDQEPGQDFVEASIIACNEDEEDKEAVETAQVLVIVSIIAQIVAVLLIAAGVFVPAGAVKALGPVSSVLSVLAGITILSALLVVRGAPVYEGVGDEPDGELEAIFIQGYVPILAVVDAILLFITSVLLCVATGFAFKEDGAEVDGDEDKEVMAEKMEDNI